MSSIIERVLVKILKVFKSDLLSHAHVQIGVGHNHYRSGELFVLEKMLKEILKKEPEIIFDIGANVGDYAKLLAKNFQSAQIFCFEPIPNNYEKLIENTKEINTINILSALGSKQGVVQLHIGENNADGSMATLYKDTLESIFTFVGEVNEVVDSPMTTLDEYCADVNYIIDFLKIDVEGHELEVLKGGLRLIADRRISVIQFEFNEFNISSKSFMFDFYKILKEYDFYRIMPQDELLPMGNYSSSLEIFRYQNILAVHRFLDFNYIQ